MKTKITTTEDVRRWWDRRPCNVYHSRQLRGSLEYSREVTHRRLLAEPHELQLMSPGQWRDKLVLEVGCGIGTASLIFRQHGARVVGFDLSPLSINLARQRREVEGFDWCSSSTTSRSASTLWANART
jgi:2-polyprenyl-3-methyl-5-hydroxy-6-metoxy-1,4-benzoquinol methylase